MKTDTKDFTKGGYTGDGDPKQLAGLVNRDFVLPREVIEKWNRDREMFFERLSKAVSCHRTPK